MSLRPPVVSLLALCAFAGLAHAQGVPDSAPDLTLKSPPSAAPAAAPPTTPAATPAATPPTPADAGQKAVAEPAPMTYVPSWQKYNPSPPPPPIESLEVLPKWRLSVAPDLVINLGRAPQPLGKVGYGASIELSRALLTFGRARLGVVFDFNYARIQATISGLPTGGVSPIAIGQSIFTAGLILDGYIGRRVRPFFAVQGGLDIAQNDSETSGNVVTTSVEEMGVLRFSGGVSVLIIRNIDIGLRADIDAVFGGPTYGMPSQGIFSPGLFTLGLEMGFRF